MSGRTTRSAASATIGRMIRSGAAFGAMYERAELTGERKDAGAPVRVWLELTLERRPQQLDDAVQDVDFALDVFIERHALDAELGADPVHRPLASIVETAVVVGVIYGVTSLAVRLDFAWRLEALIPVGALIVGEVGLALIVAGLALVWKRIEMVNDLVRLAVRLRTVAPL
jgi:hypothetical protein